MFMFSVTHAELPEKVFLSKQLKALFPAKRRREEMGEDALRSYLVICINEKGRCVAGDEMRAVRSGDVSCVRSMSLIT